MNIKIVFKDKPVRRGSLSGYGIVAASLSLSLHVWSHMSSSPLRDELMCVQEGFNSFLSFIPLNLHFSGAFSELKMCMCVQ